MKILWNHNPDEWIGRLEFHNGVLYIKFKDEARITSEMLFNSFQGAGLQVLESIEIEGRTYVRLAKVIEFSILTMTEEEKTDD